MNKIEAYEFFDCLLISFGVDQTLSTLEIITEAYYPMLDDKVRKKGIIKLTCSDIVSLHFEKSTELDFDLHQPYNENGNDFRANELYWVQCAESEKGHLTISLKADFLNFELTCNTMKIIEISNYEPSSGK